MKQLKHFALLGALLFSFIACNEEYDEVQTTNNLVNETKIKIKHVNFAEMSKNDALLKKINKLNENITKQKSNGKLVYSSEFDFYIDTDFAVYIEEDSIKHSYTFEILRDSAISALENLVVSKDYDGQYKSHIITYNLTPQERADFIYGLPVNLDNKVTSVEFDGTQLISNIFNNKGAPCGYSYQVICTEIACAIDGCWDPQYTTTDCGSVLVFNDCAGGGGGSGDNSGSGGSFTTSPIHGGGGGAPNSNNENPCEELKKLSDTNDQNINPYIDSLKQKVRNGVKKEYGVQFRIERTYDNDFNEIFSFSNQIITGQTNEVYLSASYEGLNDNNGLSIGTVYLMAGIHNHTIDGYSMFSWGDVKALSTFYNIFSNNQDIKKKVTLMVVCHNPNDPQNPLVYALKINNISKLYNQVNSLWTNPKYYVPPSGDQLKDDTKKVELINNALAKKVRQNKHRLEAYFLEFYKDYGISLYKAENNMSNWNLLELNPLTNNVNSIPCQ